MPYEEIEHTADYAIRAEGEDLAELFRSAALGMNSLIAPHPVHGGMEVAVPIKLEGMDVEGLLVDWLGELAYLAESRSMLFHRFEFEEISERRLKATLYGRTVDSIRKHIKAVTYHNLEVRETDTGLEATVVFDV
ncbi:MAG: archease [Desulfobacterales bacterium]